MSETDERTPNWLKLAKMNQEKARQNEKLDILTVSPLSPNSAPSATDSLFEAIESGSLESTALKPGNEYPILFTRLPIFIPSRRIKQKNDLMDINTAVKFDCPFGRGSRKGPPLTTFDEDIFIALLKLRQKRVRGQGQDLPIKCSRYHVETNVDHLICSMTEIIRVLGVKRNGRTYERIQTSVKNMAATTIELERRLQDRYLGRIDKGHSIRFFQVSWLMGAEEGLFEIQFEPVITRWLEREFAYVDWTVRRQLKGQLAKSVHKFLSSQSRHYEIGLKKLADSVGYSGANDELSRRFKSALNELKTNGWLKDFEIRGTGKNTPFTLTTYR